MAAVNHFYAEELTAQTNATTSYVTIKSILGSSLLASTKYLIVARGLYNGNDSNEIFTIRVSTADDSAIASKSEAVQEPNHTAADDGHSYFFVHSFTTDATPADILLEFKAPSTFTVQADQLALGVLDLTDLGSANFFETVSADDSVAYPTTQADQFTIAGSDLGTDEWVVFAYQRTGVGTLTSNYRVEVLSALDASTNAVVGTDEDEGEDTAEFRTSGFVVRHKASSGTPDFAIQTFNETANKHLNRGGYAIALKTSALADFQWAYTAGAQVIDTAEDTFETITSYSPSVTADHWLFGMWNQTLATGTRRVRMHIEDDGAEMRVGDSAIEVVAGYDSTANPGCTLFHQDNILSSDTSTYTLRGISNVDTDSVEHRWLIILSLELADAGTTGTVAVTLADHVSAAEGVLKYSGSLAETLAAFVSAASGVLKYSGTLAETTDPATAAAEGILKYSGSLSEVLANFISTAAGTVAGVADPTFDTTQVNYELSIDNRLGEYGIAFPRCKVVWIAASDDAVNEVFSIRDPEDIDLAKAGSGDFGKAIFRRGLTYTVTSAEQTIHVAAGYTVPH